MVLLFQTGTASLLLACSQFSTLSSHSLLTWGPGISYTCMCICMYIIVTMYSSNTVYRMWGYLQVVDNVAKKSMQEAVDEVSALPGI